MQLWMGEGCIETRSYPTDLEQQQYDRHCCAHRAQPMPQEHCTLVPQQQDETIYGDSHFYSSYLMNAFLEKKIDSARALDRCRRHRANTLNDADPGRALLHCNFMFAGFALWHGRFDRV